MWTFLGYKCIKLSNGEILSKVCYFWPKKRFSRGRLLLALHTPLSR